MMEEGKVSFIACEAHLTRILEFTHFAYIKVEKLIS